MPILGQDDFTAAQTAGQRRGGAEVGTGVRIEIAAAEEGYNARNRGSKTDRSLQSSHARIVSPVAQRCQLKLSIFCRHRAMRSAAAAMEKETFIVSYYKLNYAMR